MRHTADALLKYALHGDEKDENPERLAVPAGALVGAGLDPNVPRGILHGGLTGLGAAAGGAIGKRLMPEDSGTGLGLGLAGGGLLSFLAARQAIHALFPDRKERLRKESSVIDDLKAAKADSDRGDYVSKHRQLRTLMLAHPEDWHVDSVLNPSIVGVTHVTGFKFHTHRKMLPLGIQEKINREEPVAAA